MHFLKFVKFYRISILQKTAGRLLSISSNISDICALLAINQQLTVYLGPPQRTVCKQVTVFVAKIFKITKVEGHIIFVGGVDVTNKKGYLAEAVTRMCFAKKSVLKYLLKLTGKHLSLSLDFRREALLKETPT